jgi:hypothetical protein
MYPWEVSRTKGPFVFLNNLGILRILPPPVKRPGPGIAAEGGDSKASRGAAGAAPWDSASERAPSRPCPSTTMPVHFPPTLAEREVERNQKVPGLFKVFWTTFLLFVLRTLRFEYQLLPTFNHLALCALPVGFFHLMISLPFCLNRGAVPGCRRSPEAILTVLVGTAFAAGAALAKDPATSAMTRINLDVLDSIRTSQLGSRCTSGRRDRCPGRSSGGHGNYACLSCSTRCLRRPTCSLTRAGAGPP